MTVAEAPMTSLDLEAIEAQAKTPDRCLGQLCPGSIVRGEHGLPKVICVACGRAWTIVRGVHVTPPLHAPQSAVPVLVAEIRRLRAQLKERCVPERIW